MGCLRRRHQPERLLRLSERARRQRLDHRRAPAGRRSISRSPGRTARSSAWCRFTPRAIPMANTSSITAGPTPMSAPAGAITRSCSAAVPFTPVPGPRLLVAPEAPPQAREPPDRGDGRADAASAASPRCTSTFPSDADAEALTEAGFLQRIGQQFHWTNDGYGDFDDYLAALNSRKRKAVNKERREALGRRPRDRRADRRRPDSPSIGTRSTASISRPPTANGARPISTANSSR